MGLFPTTQIRSFFIIKLFLAQVQTQFSVMVKILRSNLEGEYMSHEFQSFL